VASHDSCGHTHHTWSQMVTVLRPQSQRKSSICRFSQDRTFGRGDLGLIRPHSRETQFTEQPPSLTQQCETSLFFLAEVSRSAFFSEQALTFAFLVQHSCTPLMALSWALLRPSWRPSEDRATELVSALVVGSKGKLRGRDWAGRVMVNQAEAMLPMHDAGCDGTGLGSGRGADSEVARAVTLDVEGARQYDWGMGMGAGATLEVKEAGGDCTGSGRGAETSCTMQGAALEVKGAGSNAAGRSGGLDA
jgi:hypothetical protein